MPVYEYRCDQCQSLTESLRAMAAADDPTTCEHCGSGQTRRVQSVFTPSSSTAGQAGPRPAMAPGPCGACGNPMGSCQMN